MPCSDTGSLCPPVCQEKHLKAKAGASLTPARGGPGFGPCSQVLRAFHFKEPWGKKDEQKMPRSALYHAGSFHHVGGEQARSEVFWTPRSCWHQLSWDESDQPTELAENKLFAFLVLWDSISVGY